VGLGTEILFMLLLGLLVLGPKRLHAMLGRVARAKAQLENALRFAQQACIRRSHAHVRRSCRMRHERRYAESRIMPNRV
jgi:Sec-independent protein translocase protein TatA